MIPNDRKSVQHKLLVAQLALAGFSIIQLMHIFKFSRSTICRYRDIIVNHTNEAEMFAHLCGHHKDKTKITPEVEAYAQKRFRAIYKVNRKDYNKKIREEIRQQFGVAISGESLRCLTVSLRKKKDDQTPSESSDSECLACAYEKAEHGNEMERSRASSDSSRKKALVLTERKPINRKRSQKKKPTIENIITKINSKSKNVKRKIYL